MVVEAFEGDVAVGADVELEGGLVARPKDAAVVALPRARVGHEGALVAGVARRRRVLLFERGRMRVRGASGRDGDKEREEGHQRMPGRAGRHGERTRLQSSVGVSVGAQGRSQGATAPCALLRGCQALCRRWCARDATEPVRTGGKAGVRGGVQGAGALPARLYLQEAADWY